LALIVIALIRSSYYSSELIALINDTALSGKSVNRPSTLAVYKNKFNNWSKFALHW